MSKDAQSVFLEYFGSINLLHDGLAWLLFFLVGAAWMIITVKRFKERVKDKDDDGSDVFSVMVRGLVMLLIVVAFVMFS